MLPSLEIFKYFRNHIGSNTRKIGRLIFELGAKLHPIIDMPALSLRCRPSFKTFDENFEYQNIDDTISKMQTQLDLPTKDQKLKGYCIPEISKCSFVGPNAIILGDVNIGDSTSINHGVMIRGDLAKISIGKNCHIQDNSYLYPSIVMNTINKKIFPTISGRIFIEDNVLIGPNCFIDSCKISRNAVIGPGSYVSKGCVIGEKAIIAGGSVLQPETIVPFNQIWAGNPAKYLREVSTEEMIAIDANLHEQGNCLMFIVKK